jgi:hypothetical protein
MASQPAAELAMAVDETNLAGNNLVRLELSWSKRDVEQVANEAIRPMALGALDEGVRVSEGQPARRVKIRAERFQGLQDSRPTRSPLHPNRS